MTVELIQISRDDLAAMLDGLLEAKLKPIREKILFEPDTTVLCDDDAAKMLGVSLSTLRRMKQDGRVSSISTPRGRMCRVCDVEGK